MTFGCRLWDLCRLAADDTPGVIEALGRLRNTRYHDRPVSLYGGMVELPLIVMREDGARWFADRACRPTPDRQAVPSDPAERPQRKLARFDAQSSVRGP